MRTLLLLALVTLMSSLCGCSKSDEAAPEETLNEEDTTRIEALELGHNYRGAQAAFERADSLLEKATAAKLDVTAAQKIAQKLREEFKQNTKEYLELNADSPRLDWYEGQFWNLWVSIEGELNHLRYQLMEVPIPVRPNWSSPQFDHPDSDRRLLTERDYDQTRRTVAEDADYFIDKAKDKDVDTTVAEQILATARAGFGKHEEDYRALPVDHKQSVEFAKKFWQIYGPLQMELNYLRRRSNEPTELVRPNSEL